MGWGCHRCLLPCSAQLVCSSRAWVEAEQPEAPALPVVPELPEVPVELPAELPPEPELLSLEAVHRYQEGRPSMGGRAAASPDGSWFLTTGQWRGSCRPTGSPTSAAWCHLSAPAGWPPASSTCSWVSEECVRPRGGWGADTQARGCGSDSSDPPPPPLLTSACRAADPSCETRRAIWAPPDPARAPIPRQLRVNLQSCQATNYIKLCPFERVSLSFLLLELPFKKKINAFITEWCHDSVLSHSSSPRRHPCKAASKAGTPSGYKAQAQNLW